MTSARMIGLDSTAKWAGIATHFVCTTLNNNKTILSAACSEAISR
jgi:hypothetical protein